jgi:hypothetical protein
MWQQLLEKYAPSVEATFLLYVKQQDGGRANILLGVGLMTTNRLSSRREI